MTSTRSLFAMPFALRIASLAAAFAFAAGAVASAATVEVTLTVPITLKLPAGGVQAGSAGNAFEPTLGTTTGRRLKAFDVACAIGGSTLAYSTATGTATGAIGQGSTATSGSVTPIYSPNGTLAPNPTATVILTYDSAAAVSNGAGALGPTNYVCWVVWKSAVTGVPPFFVQGQLLLKS
jgi:hypothetical protein